MVRGSCEIRLHAANGCITLCPISAPRAAIAEPGRYVFVRNKSSNPVFSLRENSYLPHCLVHSLCTLVAHCRARSDFGAASVAPVSPAATAWHLRPCYIRSHSYGPVSTSSLARIPSRTLSRNRSFERSARLALNRQGCATRGASKVVNVEFRFGVLNALPL